MKHESYVSNYFRRNLETIENPELKNEMLHLYHYSASLDRQFSFSELKNLAIFNIAKRRIKSERVKEIDKIIAELKRCYFANCMDLDSTVYHNKRIDSAVAILELVKKYFISDEISKNSIIGALKND